MKYAFALLALALASPAHASEVTCADGKEDIVAQKLSAAIEAGVANLLKAKKIDLKTSTVNGSVVVSDDSDLNNNTVTMYAEYSLNEGDVTTADGTKLSVALSGGVYPNGVDVAFYAPVLKSSGFDKEGNPINGHCALNYVEYVGYSNQSTTVSVFNAGSGHAIGSFALPKTISLY